MSDLEARLRALRDTGRRALVPYLMGGMSEDWLDALRAGFESYRAFPNDVKANQR